MDEKVNERNQHKPYWKNIHHSFSFWIFLILMFAGILYYIFTVDFAFAPKQQLKPPVQNQSTL